MPNTANLLPLATCKQFASAPATVVPALTESQWGSIGPRVAGVVCAKDGTVFPTGAAVTPVTTLKNVAGESPFRLSSDVNLVAHGTVTAGTAAAVPAQLLPASAVVTSEVPLAALLPGIKTDSFEFFGFMFFRRNTPSVSIPVLIGMADIDVAGGGNSLLLAGNASVGTSTALPPGAITSINTDLAAPVMAAAPITVLGAAAVAADVEWFAVRIWAESRTGTISVENTRGHINAAGVVTQSTRVGTLAKTNVAALDANTVAFIKIDGTSTAAVSIFSQGLMARPHAGVNRKDPRAALEAQARLITSGRNIIYPGLLEA
jgi:hypothetical protein